jgi:hypothetical protein
MEILKKNTVEPLVVDMRDRLTTITNMSTVTNLRFDVIGKDPVTEADVVKISNGVPTTNGMKVICVIDTSTGGGWASAEYRVYIKFTDGSTSPILFAGKFRVEDD